MNDQGAAEDLADERRESAKETRREKIDQTPFSTLLLQTLANIDSIFAN